MDTKVTIPVKVTISTSKPRAVMRKELYLFMYDIAKKHGDEAMKVDGKNQAEEIKHSMISILFCYTCLEAFINTIGKDKLGEIWEERWGRNKKSSSDDKWSGVSRILSSKKHGKPHSVFNRSKEPFKSFLDLKKIREDYLLHRKAEFGEAVETKYGNTDGTINTLNAGTADWACQTVKQMVLRLVENMDDAPEVKWVR